MDTIIIVMFLVLVLIICYSVWWDDKQLRQARRDRRRTQSLYNSINDRYR